MANHRSSGRACNRPAPMSSRSLGCGHCLLHAPLSAGRGRRADRDRVRGRWRSSPESSRASIPPPPTPRRRLPSPAAMHALGADFMGRDMLSRIVYGARISLAVGIGSTVLGCFFGVIIGLLSGYFGGWLDLITQRLIDIMQALPLLVMALVMAASLGPSLTNTIIAIAIPLVPQRRARHPVQHAGAARDALRRGRPGRRHERDAIAVPPRAAQHAGAADRARRPRSSARRS